MSTAPRQIAILLLAGRGTRCHSRLPKQFLPLRGRAVYLHALQRLIAADLFDALFLVCPQRWMGRIASEVAAITSPPLHLLAGGQTRQESVYKALLAAPPSCQRVLIHDGVRPFVSQRILAENIAKMEHCVAANTCIATADTIVSSDDGQTIAAIAPRQTLLRGQTPQTFHYQPLLAAHRAARQRGVCDAGDDCQLLLARGVEIAIVAGEERNFKLTTLLDVLLAQQIAAGEDETCWIRTNDPLLKREMLYR